MGGAADCTVTDRRGSPAQTIPVISEVVKHAHIPWQSPHARPDQHTSPAQTAGRGSSGPFAAVGAAAGVAAGGAPGRGRPPAGTQPARSLAEQRTDLTRTNNAHPGRGQHPAQRPGKRARSPGHRQRGAPLRLGRYGRRRRPGPGRGQLQPGQRRLPERAGAAGGCGLERQRARPYPRPGLGRRGRRRRPGPGRGQRQRRLQQALPQRGRPTTKHPGLDSHG